MLNLMKEGSKVGLAKKSRKKHEALLPVKKMKEEPFDFSAEMKELNKKGADEYLKKTGNSKVQK